MDETAQQGYRLPDEEGWSEIVESCRLNEAQAAALKVTLEEALMHVMKGRAEPSNKTLKTPLAQLDGLIDRLQRYLKRNDIREALAAIETYGVVGHLLSSTVVRELSAAEDPEVPTADIERLIAHKRFRQEPVLASDLDALCLVQRQRLVNQSTPEAMGLAIQHMRYPISTWLYRVGRDKGGHRPNTERKLLIWLLGRDSEKIIGTKAEKSTDSAFINLCTWVFDACNISTEGLEDAVGRYLKKYGAWLY
jgi:hypothetical protein